MPPHHHFLTYQFAILMQLHALGLLSLHKPYLDTYVAEAIAHTDKRNESNGNTLTERTMMLQGYIASQGYRWKATETACWLRYTLTCQ